MAYSEHSKKQNSIYRLDRSFQNTQKSCYFLSSFEGDNTACNHTFPVGGDTFQFGNLKQLHFPTDKGDKVTS